MKSEYDFKPGHIVQRKFRSTDLMEVRSVTNGVVHCFAHGSDGDTDIQQFNDWELRMALSEREEREFAYRATHPVAGNAPEKEWIERDQKAILYGKGEIGIDD